MEKKHSFAVLAFLRKTNGLNEGEAAVYIRITFDNICNADMVTTIYRRLTSSISLEQKVINETVTLMSPGKT
jgi:hypothetical protein